MRFKEVSSICGKAQPSGQLPCPSCRWSIVLWAHSIVSSASNYLEEFFMKQPALVEIRKTFLPVPIYNKVSFTSSTIALSGLYSFNFGWICEVEVEVLRSSIRLFINPNLKKFHIQIGEFRVPSNRESEWNSCRWLFEFSMELEPSYREEVRVNWLYLYEQAPGLEVKV